jgi:outer membrane protein OmpA-like peptidoglycan-associated protein
MLNLAKSHPNCGKIWVFLGNYYKTKEMWNAATESYAKALSFFPNNPSLEDRYRSVEEKATIYVTNKSELEAASNLIKDRSHNGTVDLGPPLALEILFNFDSSEIQNASKSSLDLFSMEIAGVGNYKFYIEGHTDNIGSPSYNMDLSRRRALAVKDYLVNVNGIDDRQLEIRYFGDTKPTFTNLTEEGRMRNRRVVFNGRKIEE